MLWKIEFDGLGVSANELEFRVRGLCAYYVVADNLITAVKSAAKMADKEYGEEHPFVTNAFEVYDKAPLMA